MKPSFDIYIKCVIINMKVDIKFTTWVKWDSLLGIFCVTCQYLRVGVLASDSMMTDEWWTERNLEQSGLRQFICLEVLEKNRDKMQEIRSGPDANRSRRHKSSVTGRRICWMRERKQEFIYD
jgi:hypothetical protein